MTPFLPGAVTRTSPAGVVKAEDGTTENSLSPGFFQRSSRASSAPFSNISIRIEFSPLLSSVEPVFAVFP